MDPTRVRLLFLVGCVLVSAAAGWYWRSQQGAVRRVVDGDLVDASELGAALGRRATLVQLSSVACAPCRAAHRLLTGVAAGHPGVVHVEVDVAEQLALVRRLGVLRTPTVLVLDAGGRVIRRFSGVPLVRDVEAALAGVAGVTGVTG